MITHDPAKLKQQRDQLENTTGDVEEDMREEGMMDFFKGKKSLKLN